MSGNKKLANTISWLRQEFGENLQLKQLSILLTVAINHPEPVPFPELIDQVGTTSGTVSRTVAMFGSKMKQTDKGGWKDIGTGLLGSRPDPYNTRRYLAYLTNKGAALFERMEQEACK